MRMMNVLCYHWDTRRMSRKLQASHRGHPDRGGTDSSAVRKEADVISGSSAPEFGQIEKAVSARMDARPPATVGSTALRIWSGAK